MSTAGDILFALKCLKSHQDRRGKEGNTFLHVIDDVKSDISPYLSIEDEDRRRDWLTIITRSRSSFDISGREFIRLVNAACIAS